MGTAKLGSVVSHEADLNPFELVLVGADRARQIMRGSRPMIETDANHPTSIVLEEFSAGLLQGELIGGEPVKAPPLSKREDNTE